MTENREVSFREYGLEVDRDGKVGRVELYVIRRTTRGGLDRALRRQDGHRKEKPNIKLQL